MANIKKIVLDYTETGSTVYGIVERSADGYLLNDSDGSFAAAPADPYLSFTEHSVIKGRYSLSESRSVWTDGLYTCAIYLQSGGSPVPASDNIIGNGQLLIVNDMEIDPQQFYNRINELREGNVRRVFNYATSPVPSRNVEVGQLNSISIYTKLDTATDWTSPVSTKTIYAYYNAMGDINPVRMGES